MLCAQVHTLRLLSLSLEFQSQFFMIGVREHMILIAGKSLIFTHNY